MYIGMKVTSGIKKGTILKAPDDLSVRPTTDKVKQAIYSMIQFLDPGNQALDLFSGSGAMGIEAVSRYQIKCVFVDIDTKSVSENLKKCGFSDYAEVHKEDFCSFLKKTDKKFSLVFLDPPYHKGYIDTSLELLTKRSLLCENAIIIMESDAHEQYNIPKCIEVIKEKSYGRIKIKIGVFVSI